jgi:anti-sigma factor RsiW
MSLNPVKRHREHCRETRAQMSEYLDSGLDAGAASAVERHVRWCPGCRRMLANLGRTLSGLRRVGEQQTPVDEPRP